MKADSEIRDDVTRELRWDPQVPHPEAVGVAVSGGAVCLTGHTRTYAGKLAAARAAERVYGVRAVANELEVRLLGAPRDDSDIAEAIVNALEWNTQVPADRVQAKVECGLVTLTGQVEYGFQRREVERVIRHIRGVTDVANNITVTPSATPEGIGIGIEEEFKRTAMVYARHIRVEVSDHTARLYGHVHSLKEEREARTAAAAAPGVSAVESYLEISP